MYTETILNTFGYDTEFLPTELVAGLKNEVEEEELTKEAGETETDNRPLKELSEIVGF